MKLLLVNPPNALLDRTYLAPPLGLLTVAAVVKKHGYEVAVLDLGLEVIADHALGDSTLFEFACNKIIEEQPDVVGFTSMCLESHVSLEIARLLKNNSPGIKNIVGGTHFGAIARETLESFAFVDYVITGEGEDALVAIFDRESNRSIEAGLPRNVWYREGGEVVSGGNEQNRPVLEELPFPSYDLVDLERYYELNPARLLYYEAGRGCIFKCAFCYSPFQYGDAVRNKCPSHVVEDLKSLSQLGARHIFFVQDNLLNSPRWAAELCREIAAAKLDLTWECYATYPQLNEELIGLLSQAGCVGIFTGIDAVTPESQKRMNKPFLKSWESSHHKLSYCRDKGILPICAFILEGPTQPTDKIDDTIRVALECLKLGCEIHVNTLTLYNSTMLAAGSLTQQWSYSQIKSELLFDTPRVVQDNPLARKFPRLFPYHSTNFEVEAWEIFTVKVCTLLPSLIAFHKTLDQYCIVEGNSIWSLLSYVNYPFVKKFRQTPVTQRRFEALRLFAERCSQLPLSVQSRKLFRRELAQLILSSCDTPRVVSVRVGEVLKEYVLGWFFCTSEGNTSNHDIATEMMLESQLAFGVTLRHSEPASPERFEIALRSHNDLISLYEVDEDRLVVLSELIRAWKSYNPLSLSSECVLQLAEEEWIWPVREEERPRSGLGRSEIAA